MHLLELFSGTGSVGKVAKKNGYTITSVDNSNKFQPTHLQDILKWDYKKYPRGYFHMIWASPPCTEFSKAKTTGHRDIEGAMKVIMRTLCILRYFKPKWYALENPVGLLRHEKAMKESGMNRVTVSYCKYGYRYRKDTDIWSNIPFKAMVCRKGCRCIWAKSTGRHSTTVQQGKSSGGHPTTSTVCLHQRYSIPPKLILTMLEFTL